MQSNTSRPGDDERPDPEALLDRYGLRDTITATSEASSGDSSRPQRGKLRIYLGMAAGVGKTYAMLNEGRRRKARGTDVVVAWVETHGRLLTEQQLGDLEVIPRKKVAYRGVVLEEMDLDAVLARKPAVALVDELAHTNVPGLHHPKRYQDVQDMLAAGITVITTLNVQHLEGLNDLVETITGVRQRETLPDSVLDQADEVELVDIAPEALRARLRHGNVYPPDRAREAMERYFTISNLTALRELALRSVSEKTESQLETLMEGDSPDAWRKAVVADRVLVALDTTTHTLDDARRALHASGRVARGLHAHLMAVIISPPNGDAKAKARTHAFKELAEDLGATPIERVGADAAEAITEVAEEQHATTLATLAPPPVSGPWWNRQAPLSLPARLAKLNPRRDIYLIGAHTPT